MLIAQSYLSARDMRGRGFVLGSYLLIKGSRTFVNMDIGGEPQWFPEYGVALGRPVAPPVASVDTRGWGLRKRRVSRSLVVPPHGGVLLLS